MVRCQNARPGDRPRRPHPPRPAPRWVGYAVWLRAC